MKYKAAITVTITDNWIVSAEAENAEEARKNILAGEYDIEETDCRQFLQRGGISFRDAEIVDEDFEVEEVEQVQNKPLK